MAQFAAAAASERANERERARARYQSPALKVALERAFKARASEEGHANAPRYQRPWTRFTSGVFEPYRTCPYCRRNIAHRSPPSRNELHARTRKSFRENVNTMMERAPSSGTDDRCVSEKNKLIPVQNTDQVNTARQRISLHALRIIISDNSFLSGHSAPKADRALYTLYIKKCYFYPWRLL